MSLGDKVQSARTRRSMTLAALARASRLSKGFISQVERGHSNPSLASLRRLSEALDVPLAELLSESSPQKRVTQEPKLFRNRERAAGRASLTLALEGAPGKVLNAYLPGGARLVGDAHNGENSELACVVATSGALRFRQSDKVYDILAGDILSWDPTRRYRLENGRAEGASMVLILSPGASVPRIEPGPIAQSIITRRPSEPQEEQGPMRLVAMRARRDEARAE